MHVSERLNRNNPASSRKRRMPRADAWRDPSSAARVQQTSAPVLFEIVVECADEATQRKLFDELRSAGHKCRVITL